LCRAGRFFKRLCRDEVCARAYFEGDVDGKSAFTVARRVGKDCSPAIEKAALVRAADRTPVVGPKAARGSVGQGSATTPEAVTVLRAAGANAVQGPVEGGVATPDGAALVRAAGCALAAEAKAIAGPVEREAAKPDRATLVRAAGRAFVATP
jgi:hypothetical protein